LPVTVGSWKESKCFPSLAVRKGRSPGLSPCERNVAGEKRSPVLQRFSEERQTCRVLFAV